MSAQVGRRPLAGSGAMQMLPGQGWWACVVVPGAGRAMTERRYIRVLGWERVDDADGRPTYTAWLNGNPAYPADRIAEVVGARAEVAGYVTDPPVRTLRPKG